MEKGSLTNLQGKTLEEIEIEGNATKVVTNDIFNG